MPIWYISQETTNYSIMTLRIHQYLVFLSAVFLTALSSCRTVPISGRQQFIMKPVSEEMALGLEAFQEECQNGTISTNAFYNSVFQRCATALVAASEGGEEYEWHFALFESTEQNAFCYPGGKIGVYTGIMDLMNNEAELAFVVAHEIGHAIARHYGEKTAWKSITDLGGEVLITINPDSAASVAYDPLIKYAVNMPFSRKNEYEADYIGMILMARAGYNPRAAIEFWSRFTEGREQSVLNGLMSTHPRSEDRIQAMWMNLPEADAIFRTAARKLDYGQQLR